MRCKGIILTETVLLCKLTFVKAFHLTWVLEGNEHDA